MSAPERSPVSVARNRWDLLEPPSLGEWEPTLRLSVVLPYYENSGELQLTLLALAEQTYPMGLFEAIVVDDGSPTHPPDPPPGLPYQLEVLRQDDLGYGLARARNHGARVADGEVLVFLDSDMIPTRAHLEAHARWHECASRLVSVGFRFHADFTRLDHRRVVDAIRDDSILDLFDPGDVDRPEWIDAHMERTDDLLGPFDDLYLTMSGGNIAIDRGLYLEAGGTDESFTRWGGEDNELAFRLLQLGAVVVPERAAIAWHQGEGHEPSEEELRALRLQKPKMQALIPHPSTRPRVSGRTYPRPYLLVHVDPGDLEAELVGLTVDSVLRGNFTDLLVGVGRAKDEVGDEWLNANYEGDSRVLVGVTNEELLERNRFSPVRMTLPAGFAFDTEGIDRALDEVGGEGVGLLHIVLPSEGDQIELARLVLTRAQNRVANLGLSDLSADPAIGSLFGEKWISGTSLGMWSLQDLDADSARLGRTLGSRELAEIVAQLEDVSERLIAVQSRRSMRLTDGIGTLVRARSWSEVKLGSRALREAVVPRRSDRSDEVEV